MANDGTVKIGTELDDSGFKSGLSKLGGVAKSAIAGVTAGVGAASVAIGSVAKQALSAYASYEQLVGGIETLFKDSADIVQEYAANAYKIAGVSANKYMEQATAFSASLTQSLGGDTKAAAEYANMAIMDMSDNANKMGTSIESIQQTYQSLMRGNYAMLDNLKLGYGGTKSELERLVADAEKLTGQALDPAKFSDVITAIHAVQTELGITGTTAKEASTTIEGSVNAAKAAWENWLAGLGNEDADMSALTDQLVESVKTAAENIAPVIKEILESLASSLYELIPDDVKSVIESFASTLEELSPIIAAVTAAIITFKAAMMISSIIQGVSTAITAFKAANEAATIAQAALNAVMNMNPFVLVATAVAALVAGLIVLWNTNEGFRTAVISIWEAIKNAFISAWEGIKIVWDAVKPYFSALWEGIKAIFSVVQPILSGFFSAAWNAIKVVWNVVTGYFSNIWNTIKGIFSVVKAVLSGDFKGAWEAIKNVFSGWGNFFSNLWNIVTGIFSKAGSWFLDVGKNIVKGIWNGISSMISWIKNKISGFVSSIVGGVKDFLGIHSPSTVFRDEVGKNIGLGVAKGIEDSTIYAKKSANKMSEELKKAIPSASLDVSYANSDMVPAAAAKSILAVESSLSANNSSNSMLAELKAIKSAIAEGKIIMVDKQVLGRVAGSAIRNNNRSLGVEAY